MSKTGRKTPDQGRVRREETDNLHADWERSASRGGGAKG